MFHSRGAINSRDANNIRDSNNSKDARSAGNNSSRKYAIRSSHGGNRRDFSCDLGKPTEAITSATAVSVATAQRQQDNYETLATAGR
jgi:hypothetical protein